MAAMTIAMTTRMMLRLPLKSKVLKKEPKLRLKKTRMRVRFIHASFAFSLLPMCNLFIFCCFR